MPKGSEKLVSTRKGEIIDAVEKLYRTMKFKDITLKEIADLTTFTRTSIYNYFKTKEEIFLALAKVEYERWNLDLQKIIDTNEYLNQDEIAKSIAHTLEKRVQLLKITSMNFFEIEENCSVEALTDFKVTYGNSIRAVRNIIKNFCKEKNEAEIDDFICALFPFIYGLYPYTNINEKQKEAMKNGKVEYIYHTIYELAYLCIKNLLKGDK